jgi:hypothetical protein
LREVEDAAEVFRVCLRLVGGCLAGVQYLVLLAKGLLVEALALGVTVAMAMVEVVKAIGVAALALVAPNSRGEA